MIYDRIENLKQHMSEFEPESDRREFGERRSQSERRFDSRQGLVTQPMRIKFRLQSITHPRLGVDRRKMGHRRQQWQGSLLNSQALADLIC